MDSVPALVFEQFTGNQGFRPKPGRRRSRFAEHACERNRAVDVDHRSSRSRSKSANNFSKVRPGTGLPFGGQSGPRTAGLIQPSRTPRSMTLSCSCCRGGTISATTRLRSVTTTVSPAAARRIYSLSLFFRILRPTVGIVAKWLLEATLSNDATKERSAQGCSRRHHDLGSVLK